MKGIMKSKRVLLMACALTVGAYTATANAQTANMTATAEVQNTLTLTPTSQLNFGTLAAVSDTVQTANAAVDIAGVLSVGSTGAPAVVAIVDNTAAAAAQIEVTDAADGASLNIVINNVVNPINGADTFVLDNFVTSWNGGASTGQVIATPFAELFDFSFNGGVNTIDIGADITTTTGAAAPYPDGTYAGTYDVVFSY